MQLTAKKIIIVFVGLLFVFSLISSITDQKDLLSASPAFAAVQTTAISPEIFNSVTPTLILTTPRSGQCTVVEVFNVSASGIVDQTSFFKSDCFTGSSVTIPSKANLAFNKIYASRAKSCLISNKSTCGVLGASHFFKIESKAVSPGITLFSISSRNGDQIVSRFNEKNNVFDVISSVKTSDLVSQGPIQLFAIGSDNIVSQFNVYENIWQRITPVPAPALAPTPAPVPAAKGGAVGVFTKGFTAATTAVKSFVGKIIGALGGKGGVSTQANITICHYPPGNPGNPQTLSINSNAWTAHVNHTPGCPGTPTNPGDICDTQGACPTPPPPPPPPSVTACPATLWTPNAGIFTLGNNQYTFQWLTSPSPDPLTANVSSSGPDSATVSLSILNSAGNPLIPNPQAQASLSTSSATVSLVSTPHPITAPDTYKAILNFSATVASAGSITQMRCQLPRNFTVSASSVQPQAAVSVSAAPALIPCPKNSPFNLSTSTKSVSPSLSSNPVNLILNLQPSTSTSSNTWSASAYMQDSSNNYFYINPSPAVTFLASNLPQTLTISTALPANFTLPINSYFFELKDTATGTACQF